MMTGLQNERVVLAAVPDGELSPTDFRFETGEVPPPNDGELLLEAVWLSIDPYMRNAMRRDKGYQTPIEVGQLMIGAAVSCVRLSRHPDWHEGDWVVAYTGWQRLSISDGTGLRRVDPTLAPPSTALGVLGMTGFTAYAGLRNIGRPQPGETVAVAAASGAVGSAVGQIARIMGARAIGITTGAEKLAYVRDELGFDAVVDHRAPDFAARLADAAPDGIDVYFENVGGHVWDAVLPLLNPFARVPVCGLVAHYEDPADIAPARDRLPATMGYILGRSLTVRGFIQSDFVAEQEDDYLREAAGWFADGRLRHREHVVDGLANAPAALIGQLKGGNFGKVVVRLEPSGDR